MTPREPIQPPAIDRHASADRSVKNSNDEAPTKDGSIETVDEAKHPSKQRSIDRPSIDARRIRRVRRRPSAIAAWSTLLICMILALPAMWINLNTPDIIVVSEANELATSIDTWTRINTPETKGENWIEELVPHRNGKQVWLDPPGVTWMHLLMFEWSASPSINEKTATLTVSDQGLVQLNTLLDTPSLKVNAKPTPSAAPASLADTKVTDLTLAKLDAAIREQLEQERGLKQVFVEAKWATTERSEPANPNNQKTLPAKKADPKRAIQPGDKLALSVRYVHPTWRNGVDLASMIRWARHGSMIMALITVAAVFWAGYSIGGLRTGMFSALICAANPVFIWHARLAGPAIHQTMWAMLSIAAAIWAIRPLRPSPSVERQFLGWLVCGLTFGAAGLATGPLVVFSVAGPILLILLLCPNRIGHLIGLIAALLIGVLLVLPWTALLHNHDPDVAIKWIAEHQPFGQETVQRFLDDAGNRLLLVLGALLPWTLWLFTAALQPFSTSSAGSRTRLFVGWTWFVTTIFIALTMPNAEGLGVLLPLVPAGSLVIGQLFRQWADMADEGRFARLWRWVRWPQLLFLIGASVIGPAMVSWPEPFIEQGWIDKPIFAQNAWPFAIGLMVVLLAIVGLSLRFVLTNYPGRALMCWAIWGFTLASVMAFPATESDTARSLIRPEAQHVRETVGDRPLYAIADAMGATSEIEPAFLLYLNKRIQPATAAQIQQLTIKQDDVAFVLTGTRQKPPTNESTLIAKMPNAGMVLWRTTSSKESDVGKPNG